MFTKIWSYLFGHVYKQIALNITELKYFVNFFVIWSIRHARQVIFLEMQACRNEKIRRACISLGMNIACKKMSESITEPNFQISIFNYDPCCIFRPAFGCCALQTLVEIVFFSVFAAKNLKKTRILQQIS